MALSNIYSALKRNDPKPYTFTIDASSGGGPNNYSLQEGRYILLTHNLVLAQFRATLDGTAGALAVSGRIRLMLPFKVANDYKARGQGAVFITDTSTGSDERMYFPVGVRNQDYCNLRTITDGNGASADVFATSAGWGDDLDLYGEFLYYRQP